MLCAASGKGIHRPLQSKHSQTAGYQYRAQVSLLFFAFYLNTDVHYCWDFVLIFVQYCKTLNVGVPFISRSKQNREIKGHEYQLQASISNCMVLIRQNRRGQYNFAC